MGKRSTIARLPEDILAKLQELLRDPRVTQLEATARINEILRSEGYTEKISKSAVNRYSVRMEKVGEKIRQQREIAKMWIARLGAAPQTEMGNLLNESLRGMVFEFQMKLQDMEIDEENMPMLSKFMKDLALTIQRLEASSTMYVKREQLMKISENVKKEARAAGVDEETVRILDKAAVKAIREEFGL